MLRIPSTLALLDGGPVVLRAVKRASTTGPQRFSKEFKATGVRRITQRRKNFVDTEGDIVEKSFQLYKGCTHYICKFHCNCNYIFWKKKGKFFPTDPRIRMLSKTAHNRNQLRN